MLTIAVSSPSSAAAAPALLPSPGRDPFLPSTRDVAGLLGRAAPISLSEMDDVALLSRYDAKYVLDGGHLLAALSTVVGAYRVLDVGGVRMNRYRTLYFDTPELDLYAAHQAGRANRYKVRSRVYLDSGQAFLEVKHKTNQGRTDKARIPTPALLTEVTGQASTFLRRHYPGAEDSLGPALWNDFLRITLVSRTRCERATVDLDLCFRDDAGIATLPGLVIVEIKQESPSRDSALAQALRALGVRSGPFSKYCVGAALLNPGIKANRLKPVLRRLRQVTRGERYD